MDRHSGPAKKTIDAPVGNSGWMSRFYFWLSDRFYSEFAWAFDTVTRVLTGGHITKWRKLALPLVVGPRVLDVESGTGHLLIELSRQALEVYSLDRSASMLRICEKKAREHGARVTCVRGNVYALPFEKGSFDTVLSTFPVRSTMERQVFEEFARVLKSANHAVSGPSHRLVIVGLFLLAKHRLAGKLLQALYGVSPEVMLDRLVPNIEAAGFVVDLHIHSAGMLRVPVIVAHTCLDLTGEPQEEPK